MGRKAIDMTGQKFNKLKVLYRVPSTNSKSKVARWHCKCDCGNEVDVDGTSLRSGHTKSCGCNIRLHMAEVGRQQGFKNIVNITGQKFGKLTVIDRIYDADQHTYKCLCECDCGGRAMVSADKLKSGHTTSCGCMASKGEEIINNYLRENYFNFQSQVTFDDLRNPKTNYKLRFDFGIYNNNNKLLCLIEYNGKQHYDKNNHYYSEEGIYRDKLKIEYCKKNKIPLLIIRYDEDILKKLEEYFKK